MAIPKSKILVSACLYGFCCRYDGKSNLLKDKTFLALKNAGLLVPVCAEELGGLSTPRIPSEIKDGKVISKEGKGTVITIVLPMLDNDLMDEIEIIEG